MDSWKAFDVFLCFLLLSIITVNPAQVFTVIRGDNTTRYEQDRFTYDSGCGNETTIRAWCGTFNADIIVGSIESCTCRCKWTHSTFLLSEGECVKNDFVWSSSDCKYFVGYKNKNLALTVAKPSSTYVLTETGQELKKDYDIESIEYFTPDEKWICFSTDNGVFTSWRKDSRLQLNVSSNITKYPEILGRIVKVTLGNASRNECTLFKVAGQWTYGNSTGTSASLLNPSTTLQTSKASRVYSSLPTFSSTTERKSLLFTLSLITTPQTSTRPLVVKSSFVHITSSVAGTAKPSGRITATISTYSTGLQEPSTSNSKPPVSGRRSGSDIGAAVGGGVGAVILLVALILFIVCALRHRKRRTERPKTLPAMNNPTFVAENSFSLEESNIEAKSEENYQGLADGRLNKPYESLVKNQPVTSGADGDDHTYVNGDGVPSGEPHLYQGLVKQKTPNSASVKNGDDHTYVNGDGVPSGEPHLYQGLVKQKTPSSASVKIAVSNTGHRKQLYDVSEGPKYNELAGKNDNRSGNQTYEALHPARDLIYQPLNKDSDDYDNSYQSIPE